MDCKLHWYPKFYKCCRYILVVSFTILDTFIYYLCMYINLLYIVLTLEIPVEALYDICRQLHENKIYKSEAFLYFVLVCPSNCRGKYQNYGVKEIKKPHFFNGRSEFLVTIKELLYFLNCNSSRKV